MHEEQKKSFAGRLSEIAKNVDTSHARGRKRTRVIASGTVAISLTDERLDLWDNILEELLVKYYWNKKFSEKYISSRLDEIIFKIVTDRNSEKAFEYFCQLVDDYEKYSKDHLIYIPLLE